MRDNSWSVAILCAVGVLALGCSSDDDASTTDENALGAANPDGQPGNAQTPPTTNGADVEAWLKKGDYKNWTCETAEHPQIKVSPHGYNRVCSNDLAVGFTGDVDDERPVDTASVKELYDDSSKLVGYAVGVKVKATSHGGDNWYWYERVPLDSAAPHDKNGVVADGLGSAGAAKSICVGCHTGAGSDAMHDVTGSSDYVYLQAEAAGAPNPEGDEQTPPTTSAEDIEAWLEKGQYKSWACETVEHPQLKVSPHGFNRVCSNSLAAAFEGSADDERPIGTASVKELYDDASMLVGYATSLKIDARSSDGSNWYWYERVPLDSAAPHDGAGVVANGLGNAGPAKNICVGCHAGAGSDAMHAVTGSSDYVYLQVAP
jgi:hypothetical protein